MIILEGTDAVGKTSTIKELKKENIICNDRSKDIISKYMLFDYTTDFRAKKYYEYLQETDCIILFLINNDKEELQKRVEKRGIRNEFDLQASLYNELYKETFNYMKTNDMLLEKLYLVDVTNLSLKEQVQKVKEVIEYAEYCRTHGRGQISRRKIKHP